MHADVLYLQHPETLAADSARALRRLVRLGLVAACYQHYDHAQAAFSRPEVRSYCKETLKVDAERAVERMSQAEASLGRRLGWRLMRALQNRFA